jgi:hypothetical protein
MKRIILLVMVIIQISSCETGKNKNNCFKSQVGTYVFDASHTGRLGKYVLDSIKDFRITFNKDSTFHSNMQVDFFSDTIGTWETGNCGGFESPGLIKYYTSPSEEQFGVCQEGDSFFTKISPYYRGSVTLWFKKTGEIDALP